MWIMMCDDVMDDVVMDSPRRFIGTIFSGRILLILKILGISRSTRVSGSMPTRLVVLCFPSNDSPGLGTQTSWSSQ